MARTGRPPLNPEERKAAMIVVRAVESERAEYERAAELAGLSLSDWIRARLNSAAKRETKKQR